MSNIENLIEEKPGIDESASARQSRYAELKRVVEQKGLLKRQPLYFALKIPLTLLMLSAGVVLFVWTNSLWLRLLDAVYLAFVATQIGFIGHDAGHHQIFRITWKNDLIGLANNLLLGASYCWWVDTHNKHHSKPNQVSRDPAIDYSVLAFSNEAACSKRGVARAIVKYQAYLFLPFLLLYPVSMRIDSIRFLLQGKSKYRFAEPLLMAVHFALYFWLLFSFLEVWQAVLFIVIHQSLFGLYLTSVFIPNHMGMVILEEDARLDFLTQQVITARNVKGGLLVDFWYGGLNHQIEHHLFPKMARNKLRMAKRIVEDFCREKSIGYCEVGFLESYLEILRDLRRVSATLTP